MHESRTDEGLEYLCYEGIFDPDTCSARAERAFRVKARPLVASTIYGFRAEDGVCSPPSRRRAQKLALIGPRPLWIGTTAPLSMHEPEGPRSFSRILVPVARAISSSIVVHARPSDVRIFGAEAPGGSLPEVLSYSVEVVWARSDPAPSAVGFLSTIAGSDETMNERTLSGSLR